MKKLPRFLSLLAVAAVAFGMASRAHAQLVTFDTISSYKNGDSIQGMNSGYAMTQTFTNILEVSSITYRFVSQNSSSTATSIDAYFVQWDTSTNEPTSSTPLFAQSFTVPPTNSASWTNDQYADNSGSYLGYDYTLNVSTLTSPGSTYALILVDNSSNTGLGLMNLQPFVNGDAFTYGQDYIRTGTTTLASMQSSSSFADNGDWGFSQIVIVPNGNTVPTPEPRTAAAILCALFVAGLIGRQMLLRRQEDAEGITALAA